MEHVQRLWETAPFWVMILCDPLGADRVVGSRSTTRAKYDYSQAYRVDLMLSPAEGVLGEITSVWVRNGASTRG